MLIPRNVESEWAAVYRASYPRVMDVVGDEDAVADAYARLVEDEPGFDSLGELVAWLVKEAWRSGSMPSTPRRRVRGVSNRPGAGRGRSC